MNFQQKNLLKGAILNSATSHYYPLWSTMTPCDPTYLHYVQLWPSMSYYDQIFPKSFHIDPKKAVWLFYFLKFRLQITFFWSNFGPKTSKCFVSNKTRYIDVFKRWLWIWQLLSYISSLRQLLWLNLVPKLKRALF